MSASISGSGSAGSAGGAGGAGSAATEAPKVAVKLKTAHQCDACQTTDEKVKDRCSRCKDAWYCNATCQKAHWPEHKKVCVATQTAGSSQATAGAGAGTGAGAGAGASTSGTLAAASAGGSSAPAGAGIQTAFSTDKIPTVSDTAGAVKGITDWLNQNPSISAVDIRIRYILKNAPRQLSPLGEHSVYKLKQPDFMAQEIIGKTDSLIATLKDAVHVDIMFQVLHITYPNPVTGQSEESLKAMAKAMIETPQPKPFVLEFFDKRGQAEGKKA